MSRYELEDRWPESEWRESGDLRFVPTNPFSQHCPNLARFQIREEPEHPWLIDLREPIETKAPSPALARAYCCLIRTIIFYVTPMTVRPWSKIWRDSSGHSRADKPGRSYEEWCRAEFTLTWDDVIDLRSVRFSITAPRVQWRRGRWWAFYGARRVRPEDRR